MLQAVLAIEQEPIRLPEVVSETQSARGIRVELRSGRVVNVPHRFSLYWEQTRAGASLYSLAIRSRASGFGAQAAGAAAQANVALPSVFRDVSRFLFFLVDSDLVDDLRLVQLSDAIRGEFAWPESFITVHAADRTHSLWGRHLGPRIRGASTLDFLYATLTAVSIFSMTYLAILLSDQATVHRTRFDSWSLLVGLFVSGTIVRTISSALRAAINFAMGDSGEFRWRADILGPYLFFRPHSVTGSNRRACDFLMTVGSVPVGVLFALALHTSLPATGPIDSVALGILCAVAAIAAMATHPYQQSELTTSLKVWNRAPLAWREEDELDEVESFHRIGKGLSVLLAVLGALIFVIWFNTFARSSRLPLVLGGGIVWALCAFSYIESFWAAHRARLKPDVDNFNFKRRLWATKPKVLELASADREVWNLLPVLRQLTPPVRQRLMENARPIQIKQGQAVCRQGDFDRSLYIVLEGELAVAKKYENRRRKVVAKLSSGAVFGETAFFFGAQRTADVVALMDTKLLEIPYQESMRNLDLGSSEEFQFRVWLLQALSGQGFLRDLPTEAMDTLIFAGERKKFRIGETIFSEGAPPTACYFIAQGRAAAIKGGQKIREMGVGDAFGEIGLLNPRLARTATVVAESDLLCMELNLESFWSLLSARLPLGVEIERLAMARLSADRDRSSSR